MICGTAGSGTNTSAHARSRSTMISAGARGAMISPASTSFSVTMPPTGDCTVGVGESLLERRDLRGGGGHAGACRIDLLGPGTGAQSGERFFRGPDAALRRGHAISRQVPSRRRIVSLLLRAGVVGEQGFESREVLRRGGRARFAPPRARRAPFRPAPGPGGRLPRERRPSASRNCASAAATSARAR